MLAKVKRWKRGASAHIRGNVQPASLSDEITVAEPQEVPEPADNDDFVFPDGIKVLHDSADAVLDVCFIHGLTGNRDSTWTVKGQAAPWPALLLASILSARILTYGFNAYYVRKRAAVPSVNRLLDHATNFLLDLTNDRALCKRIGRPLIVVAHSLGGLVCKQAVLLSRNHPDAHFHDIFDSLKGIVFMGTPHKGSWMANWASIPARTLSIFRSTNKSLLEILETENQLLESIQDDFLSMLRQQLNQGKAVEIACFFEEQPTYGTMPIVLKESAILEGYRHYSIYATHAGMVKFASAEETGFKRVSGELLRWQESITAPAPAPAPAPKPRTATRQRQPRKPHATAKLKNIKAGDRSTQVVGGERVNAEGFTTGADSLQIFSPDAEKVLAAFQAASVPTPDAEDLLEAAEDSEDETNMVLATSQMSR